ncbi:hypothetical protein PoB_003732800 [Plakobranchus ocellatus]|uniref:Uncharacterized protein n=1 Tax=Plakobranchus ocellatus TaxID=259542 RepID=A0AAV4ATU8_9GAST|nr:hypothetical protein PoB_003732800 [Plakobranchus ocellatus]
MQVKRIRKRNRQDRTLADTITKKFKQPKRTDRQIEMQTELNLHLIVRICTDIFPKPGSFAHEKESMKESQRGIQGRSALAQR